MRELKIHGQYVLRYPVGMFSVAIKYINIPEIG